MLKPLPFIAAHLKDKSLSMFKEALQIFKELGNDKGIARTYSILGKQYENKDTYDLSFKYQQLALRLYEKLNDSLGMAKVYNDIGSILEHKLQYNEALTYFNLALKINRKINNHLGQIGNINNIGDFFRKTGDLKQSISTTIQAKNLAVKLKNKRAMASAYHNLAQAYKLMGNTDSAYFYSEARSKIYNEVFKEENNKQINLLQTFFDVERKDHEIFQLKVDKRINMIYAYAALLICILLILLAYSIVSKQRLKSKNDKIIFETQTNFIEAELKNKLSEQHKLNDELELKSKELTSHTLQIIQKNQFLEDLKSKLNLIIKSDRRDQRKEIKHVISLIDINSDKDKNWDDFRMVFEQVHTNFFSNLENYSQSLTQADLRLLALFKMNLNSADIATMIGISQDSLRTSRYRLRQKLHIPAGETLIDFIRQV